MYLRKLGIKKNKIKIRKGSFALNEKSCFKRGGVNVPSETAPVVLNPNLLKLTINFEIDSDDFSKNLLSPHFQVLSLWVP